MTDPDGLATMIGRLAQRSGAPAAALLAIVSSQARGLGAADPRLAERLSRRAGDLVALRDRLARPPAEAEPVGWRPSALAALEAGRFQEADKALAQIELGLLGGVSDLAALAGPRRLLAGEARADRGSLAGLDLSPGACREAARRLAEAAAIVGPADLRRSHELSLLQGDALRRLGEDFGDRAGFEEALAHLRGLLARLDGEPDAPDPLRRAATQERLGLALAGLAALDGDARLLAQAAACHRAGLEDLRREQAPALWTRLQRHLGLLALQLGEAGDDLRLIEEAVAALRAALAGTQATDPPVRARAELDLGRALFALGLRIAGTAELEAAFNAFHAAGAVWTREAAPRLWSELRDRMGQVLAAMAERYNESLIFEEAIAAFDEALSERPRQTQPLLWAASAAQRGLALSRLSQRRGDPALAREALAQLGEAVELLHAGGRAGEAAALQRKLAAAGAAAQSLLRR